jgi:hypothetical protein
MWAKSTSAHTHNPTTMRTPNNPTQSKVKICGRLTSARQCLTLTALAQIRASNSPLNERFSMSNLPTKSKLLDILAALTIAAALTVCALAYFDVLVK